MPNFAWCARQADILRDLCPAVGTRRSNRIEKLTAKMAKKAALKVAPATTPGTAKKSRAVGSKTKTPTTTSVAKSTRAKRKAEDDEDEKEEKKPAKKARASSASTRKAPKPAAAKINDAPEESLDVFVFGENSSGELGLGVEGKPSVCNVKRPRLNALLAPLNVVAVATGGMHAVYLTADNKLFSCGVNDQGALGRDTSGAAPLRDEDESDDEDPASGLNPVEATAHEMSLENMPQGTVWTNIAAGDSITMAVTSSGDVYGCGTFRSNEGILGFTKDILVQKTLTKIDGLKNITSVVCGANHVLALDNSGHVFAFGSGQQNQLGRRVVERTKFNGLVPREFGLPKGKIHYIAAGTYHSFAIDDSGKVWAWGLNSFGELGIHGNAGESEAVVLRPAKVEFLTDKNVVKLAGGSHHSLAVSKDGKCYAWGRLDGGQSGIDLEALTNDDDLIRDEKGSKRILVTPTEIPGIGHAVHPACGPDHGFVINADGKAFSWGFSVNYQTAQGTMDDIKVATLIDNTATRDRKLNWAGCGGQYGVLTAPKVLGN